MNETMEKAKLKFEVRAQKDPSDESKSIFVPSIVDRSDPVSLAGVIYNAIDTGRIAGLKTSAARSVAEGICDQIYQELLKGNGIAFGKYFYIRLYLDGTVAGTAAQLTSDNHVNVRITQGSDFRVNLGDFTWTNTANDRSAGVDYVMSATGKRGEIAKNNPFDIEGRNFGTVRSAIKVVLAWTEGDEAKTAEATVTGVGENRVSCGFPQALAQTAVGTEINVTVVKTVDGVEYGSTCRQKTILAADPS